METVTVESQLAAIRAENKAIVKLLRKIKAKQDDPDGSKASERASKNGFSKPLGVTEPLREFLGLAADEKISRSEVTKRVSAYANEKNLKHPENGRVIVLDDKLKVSWGIDNERLSDFITHHSMITGAAQSTGGSRNHLHEHSKVPESALHQGGKSGTCGEKGQDRKGT